MYTLIVGIVVIFSLLMCAIVVIQKSKGGGLASGFASSNSIMGVKKTTNFLEKTTWILAACMALGSIVASKTLPNTVVVNESVMMQNVEENNIANPADVLGGAAAPEATPEAAE